MEGWFKTRKRLGGETEIMSVSKDPAANKYYEGPVFGGEGKDKIDKTSSEPEFGGVYRSAPNPKLSPEVGFTSKRDGSEDNSGSVNHALGTTEYGGPQRFIPKNLGVRDPDELEHS